MKELIYNGKIITMEDHMPRAQAVLIENGIVKKVGMDCEFLNMEEDTIKRIDLNGKVLMPEFILYIKMGTKIMEKFEEGIDNREMKNIEAFLEGFTKKAGSFTFVFINVSKAQYESLRKFIEKYKEILNIVVYIKYEEACNMLERFVMPNIKYINGIRIGGCCLELNENSQEELLQKMSICMENNWQMFCINGNAEYIEMFCNCYTKLQELEQCGYKQRPILEIQEMVSEKMLDEFNILEVYPCFWDDLYINGEEHYRERKERLNNISPFNSAMVRGIKCGVFNDFYENQENIMPIISDLVNRISKTGRVIGENEKISIPSALEVMTKSMSYQIFEERNKGSIAVGKIARFTVLDKSPYEVRKDEIANIKIIDRLKL